LEKLAAEYNGAFRLGKVDVDAEQELAAMFGIKSIPTVMLVKDGQVLDGFTGALPEGQLREFLARHVQPLEGEPAEADGVDGPAETPEAAINRLQQAIAIEPARAELKLELALALRLRSELDLAHAVAQAPEAAELELRIQANPEDWPARDQLGVRLLLEGNPEAGLEQFLIVLQ